MMNENMFCPRCGKSDQTPETFCRQCGEFLPDFGKRAKKPQTPEQHLTANSVLTLMTAVVSAVLAVLLYSFYLGKADTPVIIYITAGFLTAMTAWQIQTFWRTLQLKKHFKRRNLEAEGENEILQFEAAKTRELLNEADPAESVPPSVVENTTRKLKVER